jgi:hypothetical protein
VRREKNRQPSRRIDGEQCQAEVNERGKSGSAEAGRGASFHHGGNIFDIMSNDAEPGAKARPARFVVRLARRLQPPFRSLCC